MKHGQNGAQKKGGPANAAKHDHVYLRHILNAMNEALELSKGLDEKSFKANRTVQLAIITLLQIVGEASKQVSHDMRSAHADIPWKKMSGMRDKLLHDYLGVDMDLIWVTLTKDLPVIKIRVVKVLEPDVKTV